MRGLLNKLTPEKFDKLAVDFCQFPIRNAKVLKGIIVLILDKALNEPAYSALYAQLCQRLDRFVPNFEEANSSNSTSSSDSITTFRKLLLTVCQHEFDNRANYYEATGDAVVDEAAKQLGKKKMLGNVKFIGELGRLDLLSEAILHKCIKTLLDKRKNERYADMAEDLECLCKILPTVGRKLDQGEAVKLMDQYFERMKRLKAITAATNAKDKQQQQDALPQRIRFMLQDCIDLRANGWVPRQTQLDQAPKTMHEVRHNSSGLSSSPHHNQQQQQQSPFIIGNGSSTSASASAAAIAAASHFMSSYMSGIGAGGGGGGGNGGGGVSSHHHHHTSAAVASMFQQLSQQPNMSLLNAINGMRVRSNASSTSSSSTAPTATTASTTSTASATISDNDNESSSMSSSVSPSPPLPLPLSQATNNNISHTSQQPQTQSPSSAPTAATSRPSMDASNWRSSNGPVVATAAAASKPTRLQVGFSFNAFPLRCNESID